MHIGTITEMSNRELQHWLTRFILEIHKQDCSPFPPNSLHHIAVGLMRYLRWNGKPEIYIFHNSNFMAFWVSLDAEMKRPQGQGIGKRKKQAQILTEKDEELLWTTW